MKKVWIRILSGIITAVLAAVLIASKNAGSLSSQRAVARWSSDGERFAQLSMFISSDADIHTEDIFTLREAMENKLTEASIVNDSGGRLWIDAYSSQETMTAEGSYGSTETVVTGVGGDFFLFHPLEIENGWYFFPHELSDDRIVLDCESAWSLFGSFDVAGQRVKIGDSIFTVSGVVKKESDKASRLSHEDAAYVFIPFAALQKINPDACINVYETVVPNPVTSFAYNILKDINNIDEHEVIITENSGRYSIPALISLLRRYSSLSVRNTKIILPYWENAARITENKAALRLLLGGILSLYPFILLLAYTVRFFRTARRHFGEFREKLSDKWDAYRSREKPAKKH